MFKFLKEFRVVTVMDYRGYNEDKEAIKELSDQFVDVVKHFSIGYSDYKRRVIDVPHEVRNRGNVTAFGTGKILQLSWKCVISPGKWQEFVNDVNDYVKDKNYATFTIYE